MKQDYFLPRPVAILMVCLVCFCTFFVNNDVLVPDIMESRNIITAREMVEGGSWMVPQMNGDLRLEKPPLPTWLTALAEMADPDNLALQRAMAALAAVLLVVFFWKFASRVLRIDPLVPVLLLCTCYNVILMGRTASWDIYCHAFMMAGIYFLARALLEDGPAWGAFIWAGVFTGLSIMSKGPVSPYALLLPFILAFAWVRRPSCRGKGWPIAVMILVALAIGAWWYVYVHFAAGDRLAAVVQKESGNWTSYNVRPWWYYWKFFLETGVWSLLLLTAIFLPLFTRSRRDGRVKEGDKPTTLSSAWLLSLAWLALSLVLLSAMPEKKSRYLLPILIPASYVMGCMVLWWVRGFRGTDGAAPARGDAVMFRINTALVTLAVLALPVVGWFTLVSPGWLPLWLWIVMTVGCALIATWLVLSMVQLRPLGLVWGVTLLFVMAEVCVMPSLGKIINNPYRHSIEAVRQRPELQGMQFYRLDSVPMRIELVYAAHRTILPISPDTLLQSASRKPMVVITRRPFGDELPGVAARLGELGLDTVHVDRYDDNRRPKGNKRYSAEFIYHATVIKNRNNPNHE